MTRYESTWRERPSLSRRRCGGCSGRSCRERGRERRRRRPAGAMAEKPGRLALRSEIGIPGPPDPGGQSHSWTSVAHAPELSHGHDRELRVEHSEWTSVQTGVVEFLHGREVDDEVGSEETRGPNFQICTSIRPRRPSDPHVIAARFGGPRVQIAEPLRSDSLWGSGASRQHCGDEDRCGAIG